MNPAEIRDLLKDSVQDPSKDIDFVGFPHPERVSLVMRLEKVESLRPNLNRANITLPRAGT